jgi:hypothetical protein
MVKNKNEQLESIRTGKELVKEKQTEFRINIQNLVNDNMKRMQDILETLDAKEFCDVLIKIIPFGFAKVPEEKKPAENEDQNLVIEKTVLTQKLLK